MQYGFEISKTSIQCFLPVDNDLLYTFILPQDRGILLSPYTLLQRDYDLGPNPTYMVV